jgi:uncharacterized DUF497 family protein
MVFSATFNNISVISMRSVLLVEETGVHGEIPHVKFDVFTTTSTSQTTCQTNFVGRQLGDCYKLYVRVRLMVFSATFNNISVISMRSVLLVEETGVHGENHRPVASH